MLAAQQNERRRVHASSCVHRLGPGRVAAACGSPGAPAIAQAWPTKPLHMVIPYPPGGPSDVSTRIVMERAAQILGQSVLFDNKAGASGMIGAEFVKNQPVDTYTFLTTTTAMVCITRHLQPIPFDPEKDFIPVSRMTTSWGAFAVHPSVPAKTVAEFVAYAKANPGKINFGSAGPRHHHPPVRRDAQPRGRHPDDARALSRQRAGDQRPAGRRSPGRSSTRPTLPHIKAGKLRGLAMLAEVRHPDFPDIPTLRETGYGKDGGDSWFGILAPAGTSPAVVGQARPGDRRSRCARPTSWRRCTTAACASPISIQSPVETAMFGDIITGHIRSCARSPVRRRSSAERATSEACPSIDWTPPLPRP